MKHIHIDMYDIDGRFRFHCDTGIEAGADTNIKEIEQCIRSAARAEIARVKEHFKEHGFGAHFGRIRFLRVDGGKQMVL